MVRVPTLRGETAKDGAPRFCCRIKDRSDNDCCCDEGDGDEGGGVEDLIVGGVGGVVEEEVVLDAQVGDDGHLDLDVTAFVGSGEDVDGGYA